MFSLINTDYDRLSLTLIAISISSNSLEVYFNILSGYRNKNVILLKLVIREKEKSFLSIPALENLCEG